jgi:hypothetical protein
MNLLVLIIDTVITHHQAQDSKFIKDGDIFAYAGVEAKKLAETIKDMVDIETLTFRELKARTKTQTL